VCQTDFELLQGYYPFTGILGHEFVGRVVDAPDPAWMGRRVCGEINVGCGECGACLAGAQTHCRRRSTLGIRGRNGSFADYLTLPLRNLHAVPEGVSDDEAVFTEPLAAALQIPEQVPLRPSHRIVVIGDGRLGNLCAQVLALSGAHVQVIGRHADKLGLLAARGLAIGYEGDVVPQTADVVVDCSGTASGFLLACAAVRPRGTLVLKSTFHGEASLNLSPLVVNEVTLVGSLGGPFEPALRLLERGLVDVRSLIAAHYPVESGLAAFEVARSLMKVIVTIAT
jgi:threonine dehydrogenase-like Zn-dependent dehydrogenase